MERLSAASIVPIVVKLAVISFAVGIVFAVLGIDPVELWRDLGGTVRRIWEITLDVLEWCAQYALLGAVVVVPIWAIYRGAKLIGAPRNPRV